MHDPAVQPFSVAWTDVPSAELARSVLQYYWSQWGSWRPADWTLDLVAERAGTIVGTQGIRGQDFAVRREVSTGSWVGQQFQGQGFGTQMRAAVLHLAFEGLGAQTATSGAYEDNEASLAVSARLGYTGDGTERHTVRGQLALLHRLRLDQEAWRAHRSISVQIEGLPPCLPSFGLSP